jgi:hypothetical protein
MFRQRSFKDERIILDGARFLDCTFEGTTLVFFGGQLPEMQNCSFSDVRFSLEGPAGNTLDLLRKLRERGIALV